MDIATRVKLKIYQQVSQSGAVPDAVSLASSLKLREAEVKGALEQLAVERLLVLEPGSDSQIRMAPPFSAVPTPFQVVIGPRMYFANCIWDAYGIAAALSQDANIETSDAFTGDSISLEVVSGTPMDAEVVFHFAVPAAQWWDDIIYT